MKKPILIVIIVIALAIAATYYPWQQTAETESIVETTIDTGTDSFLDLPESNEEPAIKYPVPETPAAFVEEPESETSSENTSVVVDIVEVEVPAPLPLLDESDNAIAAAIRQLTDIAGLFSFESFIRHFVVTIDNMTNQKLPQRYVFTQKVPATFTVIKQDVDTALLDEKNFKRYESFVSMAEYIDTRKLVVQYIRFYPLFQEAYEELGYPGRYFNDRFIQVIDHLLKAPEVNGSIKLVRPKVFWLFANPELESLSAGQKILVRIGPENAGRVKVKLKELRRLLTTFSPY
ncbi:MAG: DUF3014 domain-containing protein [Gammaproteobacteria bacterium]|nr:MAG: DUF3014 domain-containing protein [Gammaproteobacteria bacterium]